MFDWDLVHCMADGGDGAGGAGDGGGFAGADTGETGQDAAGQTDEGAQSAQQKSPPVRDEKARRAEYNRLIRGEYSDIYKADKEKTVQGRLKEAGQAKSQLDKLSPALRVLQRHYGTDDLDALAAAVTGDDRYYEREAQRRGMDTETFRMMDQRDETIRSMQAEREAAREQQEKTRRVMQWRQDEAAMKETFPDFDLDAEIENSEGEFFRLLESGISMEHAYMVLHMDDVAASVAQRTARRVADTVRANGLRPMENGAGKAPPQRVGTPVSKLTSKQMDELERRAARGEIITPDKFG